MENTQTKSGFLDKNNIAMILFLFLVLLFGTLLGMVLNVAQSKFLDDNLGYIVMYIPGLAGLIACRVNHEQFPRLGLKMCPVKYLLLATAIPILCYVLSYSIYWTLFPDTLRSEFHFSIMLLVNIPIHIFFAFGEELGWRGFWAPVMTAKFGYVKASIYIGIIWGLWHSPTFLEHYYYSGATILFVCGTVAFSIMMNYFRLKNESIWPAVMIHAAQNYTSSVLISFTTGTKRVYLVGAVGIITVVFIVLTAILFLFYAKKDPDLVPYKKARFEIKHELLT